MVENPGLWNWTFTLKDIDGEVLAQVDRDWRGFGFEVEFSHSLFFFMHKNFYYCFLCSTYLLDVHYCYSLLPWLFFSKYITEKFFF